MVLLQSVRDLQRLNLHPPRIHAKVTCQLDVDTNGTEQQDFFFRKLVLIAQVAKNYFGNDRRKSSSGVSWKQVYFRMQ